MEKLEKISSNVISTITSHLPGMKKGNEKAVAVNPFTQEKLSEHDFISDEQLKSKIKESWNNFMKHKKSDPKERERKFAKMAEIMKADIDKFAKVFSMEMGKPIKESRLEVEKAIKECEYFAKNTAKFLENQPLKDAEGKEAYVSVRPLGVIYHVTPFNFPFWLIFRGSVGALAMGNTVINKNPQTCPQTGIIAEQVFVDAGFTNGEFMNLIINQSQSELIISDNSIRAVSFTGSTEGGKKVGAWAGQYCKKAVLELGGNDPFIVHKDADLDLAVEKGVQGRLLNGGQCCTAAKRFIIDESIYENFKDKLLEKVKTIKVGDPLDDKTDVGPLAKKSGLEKQLDQIKRAKEKGAKILLGGGAPKGEEYAKGNFFEPTVLEVDESNPIYHEETFGPVFTMVKFKDENDVLRMANDTEYGLGSAIFTRDIEKAKKFSEDIDAGTTYINHHTDWDVACPEGGVKMSGFGRDGGREGAYEWANIKTIWIGDGKQSAS